MKILVGADVNPNPDAGASGTVVATSQAFRELGHEVEEIWASDLGRRIQHGNLHYFLELPRSYRREVMKRVVECDYDVVQLSQPWGWLAAKALKESGFRGVVINRSHGHEVMADRAVEKEQARRGVQAATSPKQMLSGLLQRRLHHQWLHAHRWFDGFVVPATDIKEFMIDDGGVEPARVAVAAHGVPNSFRERAVGLMTAERAKRVLHVGQYAFFKGSQTVVEAFRQLAGVSEGTEFTWVCGEAHHAMIREQLGAVADRVALIPWGAQEELLATYDRHGIFLFPSIYEGFGKAPLEAMSRGLCVVGSNVGGMRDLIVSGENGLLCEPGDAANFVEKVTILLGDLGALQSMSKAARQTGKQYSWAKCASEALDFYRSENLRR